MVSIMYDVVISGAGPSGSQCAEVLAKAGYKIALIEKDTNWRKPCGGGITYRVLEQYPKLKKLSLPKIEGVVMYSADYHKLEYKSEKYKRGTVIDRLELDNLMRNIAVDAGAELFDKNLSFNFITKNQKKIGIKTKSPSGIKEYYGNIIIVADGMSSKLAPKSGLRSKWKIEELGIAKCAIMEGENQLDEEFIYMFFKPYKGYSWIFPLGKKRFNIGAGTFGEDNLKYNINEIYDEFLSNPNIKKYVSGSNYKIIWIGSYPFPVEGVLEKSLYADNLMLIGDTGGFVSPISEEGIHTSVVSGKAAAETAIEALQEEDFSKNILKKYKKRIDIKQIIRNFKLKLSMRKFFYENKGKNLNNMFELSEKDFKFREQVVKMFGSKTDIAPSKDFLKRIYS